MMTNGDREWRFFYPTLTFFFLLTIKCMYRIFIFKKKVPEYAEMRHDMMKSLQDINDVTCLPTRCCSILIFPTGLYGAFGVEFSHTCMGRNSGEP